jgi:Kdo2-lipid IVA lauroyltransferase/acyltransferase
MKRDARRFFREVRFKLELMLLRAYSAAMSSLPLDFAINATGWVAQHLPAWSGRDKRAARHLQEAMPELDAAIRARILRDMRRGLGMTIAETVLIDRIAQQPDRITLDAAGREALQLAKDSGAVFVCPHIGNWEVSVLPFVPLGICNAAVYMRVKNPLFDAELLARRKKYYPGGLYEQGRLAAKALARHLQDGGTVGVMADLRDDLEDCVVPFFGRDAPSTIFPALLARRYNRPLIADCVVRIGPGRFQLKVEKIPVPHTADRRADIRDATASIQACFERWIRQNPDQWLWAHRRYQRQTAPANLTRHGRFAGSGGA